MFFYYLYINKQYPTMGNLFEVEVVIYSSYTALSFVCVPCTHR
jgi:hypothetical protein